jgi:drug/metabolite transporter (DMT)-like permease
MPAAAIVLPLVSGFLYAIAGLFLKQTLERGVGVLRVLFVSNISMMLVFSPFSLLADGPVNWDLLWAPVLTGLFFFTGQVFTFVAIRLGDVSVQAPVMGTKVLFVAFFTVILQAGPVPLSWWGAACLTTLAIALLGISSAWRTARSWLRGIGFALIASIFFALSDILIQLHAQAMQAWVYIALTMVTVGLLSLAVIPFFREGLHRVSRRAWPSLLAGSLVLAVQCLGMAIALGFYGRATAANILYSSRGLWSIVLVALIGVWFGNREYHAGRRVMVQRLAGAALLLTAIIWVLSEEL